MEDPEPAVGDCGGSRRIGRKLPLKRTVRPPTTTNVLSQIVPSVDDFCIGILESPLTVRVVERSSFGKDIANSRIDRAGKKRMGLLETGDDFWSHSCEKRKGPGRLGAL